MQSQAAVKNYTARSRRKVTRDSYKSTLYPQCIHYYMKGCRNIFYCPAREQGECCTQINWNWNWNFPNPTAIVHTLDCIWSLIFAEKFQGLIKGLSRYAPVTFFLFNFFFWSNCVNSDRSIRNMVICWRFLISYFICKLFHFTDFIVPIFLSDFFYWSWL